MRFQLLLLQADAAEYLAKSDPPAAASALIEAQGLAAEMGAVTLGPRLARLALSEQATLQA